MGESKYISVDQARQKMQAYCAYQERCHVEVVEKMRQLGLAQAAQDEIMMELLRDNYLNEERFARAFARGKFRIKHYGRNRIKQELQKKQVGAKLIQIGLSEICPEQYQQTLFTLAERIAGETKEKNPFKKRKKCTDFLLRKGYEFDLIQEALNVALQENSEYDE